MTATRIGLALMTMALAACTAAEPAPQVIAVQPFATARPIVLYPPYSGLGAATLPPYGDAESVARAPDVLIEPLDDVPGLGQPPGPGWVLPD